MYILYYFVIYEADFKRFAKNKMKQMYKEAAIYSSSAGDYIFELLSGTE